MSASRQEITVSSKSSSTKLEHEEDCLPLQLRASCQMFCHGVCEPNDFSRPLTQQARAMPEPNKRANHLEPLSRPVVACN